MAERNRAFLLAGRPSRVIELVAPLIPAGRPDSIAHVWLLTKDRGVFARMDGKLLQVQSFRWTANTSVSKPDIPALHKPEILIP
jgi:hypothetical protein